MKYYSIGGFANKIGKTVQTLRNWDNKGILKPHHITGRWNKILFTRTT